MDDPTQVAHLSKLLEEERQKRMAESKALAKEMAKVSEWSEQIVRDLPKLIQKVGRLEAENRRLLTENAELREKS